MRSSLDKSQGGSAETGGFNVRARSFPSNPFASWFVRKGVALRKEGSLEGHARGRDCALARCQRRTFVIRRAGFPDRRKIPATLPDRLAPALGQPPQRHLVTAIPRLGSKGPLA